MVQLPWAVYEFTGDLASVAENYDAMILFLRAYYPDSPALPFAPRLWATTSGPVTADWATITGGRGATPFWGPRHSIMRRR